MFQARHRTNGGIYTVYGVDAAPLWPMAIARRNGTWHRMLLSDLTPCSEIEEVYRNSAHGAYPAISVRGAMLKFQEDEEEHGTDTSNHLAPVVRSV